jgi:hypothetical protein
VVSDDIGGGRRVAMVRAVSDVRISAGKILRAVDCMIDGLYITEELRRWMNTDAKGVLWCRWFDGESLMRWWER